MVRPGLSALKGKLKLEHVSQAIEHIDKNGTYSRTNWDKWALALKSNINKCYKPKEIMRLAYWRMKIENGKATAKVFGSDFYGTLADSDYGELDRKHRLSGGWGADGANTFLRNLDPNVSVYHVGEGGENGMKNSKDVVTRQHLEFALNYIREKGTKHERFGVTALFVKHADIKYCIVEKGVIYSPIEAVRVAYLHALEEGNVLQQQCEKLEISPDFSWDDIVTRKHIWLWDYTFPGSNVASTKRICAKLGYTIKPLHKTQNDMLDAPNNKVNKHLDLLLQFPQVIFYGPPGTGKTYQAKKVIERMLGADIFNKSQGDQWDIVQFHPSYNYEDFVRGVQVKTEKGQVTYETKNRIFADMCAKALKKSNKKYALIIDEINRANVSSVLGELIYALEYRGESVSTPYEVIGSRLLTIPHNLFIIGTMNTADRTIGALDYAVRRRFAFVHCPPDKSLIEDAEAKSMFDKVKHIFAKFLSPDFDAADVEIGHSYFMVEGEKLRAKIQYQVVPILNEYVKDGVLLPKAKDEIKELLDEESSDIEDGVPPINGITKKIFRWEKEGREGKNRVGRTVLDIIRDYVKYKKPPSLEKLKEDFPDSLLPGKLCTVASEDDPNVLHDPIRYFVKDPIDLPTGKIVVCTEWGVTLKSWTLFKNQAKTLGYSITKVK